MSRLFALLLLIAAFTGIYWLVMSGYATERLMAMDIRAAARQPDAASILEGLRLAEVRLDAQKRWVARFGFLARDPDWSQVKASRDKLHRLQKETNNVALSAAGDVGPEAVEQTRRYLRAMPLLRATVLREGQDTLWKWLFWLSGVGTAITALLVFVRRVGD